ncbi:MAG: hypothetical protein HQM09_08365 [Candidatus Riflebacteria bacterium]|nr:hypothetical protein [Candidatus Riflebacteria bacterium]
MATRSIFEKRILREIHDIPEFAQEKLEKLIRFFKEEFLGSKAPSDERTKELLALAGSWEDDRPAEEIIREIYSARRSRTKPVRFS